MVNKRFKILVVVLAIFLFAAVVYIITDNYLEWKQERDLSFFQQGAQFGFEQAILQVANQAAGCQQVPLAVGNQTVNVISIDCLTGG